MDFGCGWGELLLRSLAAGGTAGDPGPVGVGVDVDEAMLEQVRRLAAERAVEQRSPSSVQPLRITASRPIGLVRRSKSCLGRRGSGVTRAEHGGPAARTTAVRRWLLGDLRPKQLARSSERTSLTLDG